MPGRARALLSAFIVLLLSVLLLSACRHGDTPAPAVTPARPLTPIIFVPGQPASLPSDVVAAVNRGDVSGTSAALTHFLTHLGTHPSRLTSSFDLHVDLLPGVRAFRIQSPTNPLVAALEKQGYVRDVNLFIATHDWRMPIAPPETGADRADDGILRIGATLSNANDQFDHGLDYLAYWLRRAGDAWLAQTGEPLRQVDVISHSEGYLLTRAYVSSTLYDGTYTDAAGSIQLPKIRRWVSLGPPNGGASGIFKLLKNDFNNPLGVAEDGSGLYPIVELAYLAVTVGGQDIVRPDGSVLFARGTRPDASDFIQQWIPSLRSEMATYPFLDDGRDVNDDPLLRNDLLLDLNHGGPDGNFFGDPAGFVSRVETMSVVYGVSLPTPSRVVTRTGPGGWVVPLTADLFGAARPTTDGEVWFKDVETPDNGDSVLPLESAELGYKQNPHPNLKLYPQRSKAIDHDAEVSNGEIHKLIVKILGLE